VLLVLDRAYRSLQRCDLGAVRPQDVEYLAGVAAHPAMLSHQAGDSTRAVLLTQLARPNSVSAAPPNSRHDAIDRSTYASCQKGT
jgi:hypothetical protein